MCCATGMASTSSENISTVKPRVKGPPCRGWEKIRRLQKRQRTQQVLQAVIEDSDFDEDYEPSSNPETELSSSDAEGTEQEPVSTVAEASGNEHQQSPVSVPQILIPKGKKQMRGPENWLKNKKKKARNSGKQYADYKGRIVHAKTLPDMTNHVCRRRCAKKSHQQT